MDYKKKLTFRANSAVQIIAIVVLLILINVFFGRHFWRIDLTADEQFSVSDETKNILETLPDTLTVKIYFSEKLPPNLSTIPQYTRDIVEEFKAFSKGNLNYRFLDPSKDEKYAAEAQSLGIPERRLNVIEKDKLQIQSIYLGMAIFYRDKKEVIPMINVSTLEYDLIAAIRKITASRLKVIGFLKGYGAHLFQGSENEADYLGIGQALSQNYTLQAVDVSKGNPIKDIDTLIIAGLKENLSERELFEVDQFMMGGGTVIFLVDKFAIDNTLSAKALSSNIGRLFEQYGIKIQDSMILDGSHANATFQQGPFIRYTLPYPYWVMIPKAFVNQTHPTVSNLEGIVFPWASPLEIEKKEGVTVDVLLSTTLNSWTISGTPNLDPAQQWTTGDESKVKSYPMAAIVSTPFKGIFSTIPKLEVNTSDSSSGVSVAPEANSDDANRKVVNQSADSGRLVVMGSSLLPSDTFVNQFQQNAAFFLNLVDYVTLDPALASIRSKGLSSRPLKELSPGLRSFVKLSGILGMPVVISIIGVLRFMRRKKKKKMVVVF